MGNQNWLSYGIQLVCWLFFMSLFMGWMGKKRLQPRPVTEANKLAHPTILLTLSIACLALFISLTVLMWVAFLDSDAVLVFVAIPLIFVIMSIFGIMEYFNVRHEISENGLAYGKFFGKRGQLQWSELQKVRYSASQKWFRLETQTGSVVRISIGLMGLPEFARTLLEHTPATTIDDKTRQVLKDTADGNPPSLWD